MRTSDNFILASPRLLTSSFRGSAGHMSHRGAHPVALSTGVCLPGLDQREKETLDHRRLGPEAAAQTHLPRRMAPSQAEPKPGDLIEIPRFLRFAHWAVYVGDGYVVHVAPSGAVVVKGISSGSENTIVKKELLSEVAGKQKYHVNNKHDDKYKPLPPSKIVQRAEELVGQKVPYQLTSENCEHFVNELRYGVHRCDQIPNAEDVGVLASILLFVTGAILTIMSFQRN